MGSEGVELVRCVYLAWQEGDVEELLSFVDPEVSWSPVLRFPEGSSVIRPRAGVSVGSGSIRERARCSGPTAGEQAAGMLTPTAARAWLPPLSARAPLVEGVILAPEGGRGGLARVVLGGDRSPVGSGVEVAQQREDLDLHAAE